MPRRRRSTPSSTGCSSIGNRRAAAIGLAALAALAGGSASGSAGGDPEFKLARSSVGPKHAYFAGRTPATLRYLFRSAGEPRDVRLSVVEAGGGAEVARWRHPALAPGKLHRQAWRGARPGGGALPDGAYAFRIKPAGGSALAAGRFRLHGHRFPVKGAHGTRGPIGEFGAPRSGGRVHEGFDITAPCGTPLLALRAGRVERSGYDPRLYGHFIEVDARDSRLDYFYAHLKAPAAGKRGAKVKTSERLGKVGLTGNAAGTPCHLHVELRRSGRAFDPKPKLQRWDRYG